MGTDSSTVKCTGFPVLNTKTVIRKDLCPHVCVYHRQPASFKLHMHHAQLAVPTLFQYRHFSYPSIKQERILAVGNNHRSNCWRRAHLAAFCVSSMGKSGQSSCRRQWYSLAVKRSATEREGYYCYLCPFSLWVISHNHHRTTCKN